MGGLVGRLRQMRPAQAGGWGYGPHLSDQCRVPPARPFDRALRRLQASPPPCSRLPDADAGKSRRPRMAATELRLSPARRGRALARLALSRLRRSRRSEEHTSKLQSLMRISFAVFCLKQKTIYDFI